MRIIMYVLAIILANVLTSTFPPLPVAGFLVPTGTLLIGFTFIMRDLIQLKHGRTKTYWIIVVALILSAIVTYLLGNGVRIVIASAVSFAFSEFLETEIFTMFKASLSKRVLVSGTAASILDSILFSMVAGFPIEAAIGQTIVKILTQCIGALFFKKYRVNAVWV